MLKHMHSTLERHQAECILSTLLYLYNCGGKSLPESGERKKESRACLWSDSSSLCNFYLVKIRQVTRLYYKGRRDSPVCTRCSRDHGDLIHLIWQCPKLHLYWRGVITTINKVFPVQLPEEPKQCLLGTLLDLPVDDIPRLGHSSRPAS